MFGSVYPGQNYFGQAFPFGQSYPDIAILLIIKRSLTPILVLERSAEVACVIERSVALPVFIGRTISED